MSNKQKISDVKILNKGWLQNSVTNYDYNTSWEFANN